MSKRQTRRQKYGDRTVVPKGKSKYARKVARRRKLARQMGLEDCPFPLMEAIDDDRDTTTQP